MKTSQKINSLHDLKAEIARLNIRKKEQEAYLTDQYNLLSAKISAPFRFFNRITSRVPGAGLIKDFTSNIGRAVEREDTDWLTKALRLGVPMVLNSTILRKSGWVKKAMVLLASETAIGQINKDKLSGFISKVTSFIRPKKKKKKKKGEDALEKLAVMDQQASILEDERYNGA